MYYFLKLWVLFGFYFCSVIISADGKLNCDAVKSYFEEQGFPATDIPKDPISSKELKTCGGISSGGEVCCSADMELRLQARAKDKHEKALNLKLNQLHQLIASRAHKFNNFFKDLLTASKRGFHEMFKKTYGILYEQNAYLFTDFFKELENYFLTGSVNLDDIMDHFFNTLYQKMFTVLNSQYNFDAKYLVCVGDNMKEMRPFGDVPQKLGVQIKRSFVATRSFSQALAIGADVIKKMQTLRASPECAAALTRMTACPSCSGISGNVLACGDMCANVMKGCLSQHAQLDADWNHFVEAIGKVADRLLGPFNIEMLIRPINLKISEGIMNFQENSQDVSQRVFTGCGKPVLGRRRRRRRRRSSRTESYDETDTADTAGTAEFEDSNIDDGRSSSGVIDKLVREIRQRVRDSRQFWVYLPYQLCNDGLTVPASNTKECWNGTHVDKYIYPVLSDNEPQTLNPELRESGQKSQIVKDSILALATISGRLRSAFNGQDIDWLDAEEVLGGSGSGSGDRKSSPGTPIDDEDGYPEASGDGGDNNGNTDSKSSTPENVDVPAETPSPTPTINNETKKPIPRDPIDNHIDNTDDNNINNNNSTSTISSSGHRSRLTLWRAVTSYLFPVAVMWVGGCFTELL